MQSVALLLLLAVPAFGASCDEGWKQFKGACYKQFYNKTDRVDFTTAEARCVAQGAHLTTSSSGAEAEFITRISRLPGTFHWRDLPLIGVFRNIHGNFENIGGEKAPFARRWCQHEPNNQGGKENCILLRFDAVVAGQYVYRSGATCMYDVPCTGDFGGAVKGFSRYICKKIVPGLEPTVKPVAATVEAATPKATDAVDAATQKATDAVEAATQKAADVVAAIVTEKGAEAAVTAEPAKATSA